MGKKALGEFVTQAGVFLLFLPIIFLFLVFAIGFLATITVTTTMLIVFGVIVYYAKAIFLIVYGRSLNE